MLGTGNAMSTRCYNTCFFLRTQEGGLMVDGGGGNGILKQLHRAGIPVESLHHLFVTHCHCDHILGVLWLIRKISSKLHYGRYTGTFTIYCHNEVRDTLLTLCRLTLPAKIVKTIDQDIVVHTVSDGEQVMIDGMKVTFFDIASTKLKQFGFSAVMPSGKRVACLGDEPYNNCNEQYVKGCDWMLSEAFCLDKDKNIFHPYEKHHSTALDAGRQAEKLGVKNLLLYHTEDTHLATRRETYTFEARRTFTGNVHVPDDLETVNL